MKKFYVPRRKRWQGRNNNFRAWEYLHSSNKSYLHFWLQALQVPDLICWPWNFAFWLSWLESLHWLSKSVPGYDCPDLLKMFLLTTYLFLSWLAMPCLPSLPGQYRGGGIGFADCAPAHPLFGSFLHKRPRFVPKKLESLTITYTHILLASATPVYKRNSSKKYWW